MEVIIMDHKFHFCNNEGLGSYAQERLIYQRLLQSRRRRLRRMWWGRLRQRLGSPFLVQPQRKTPPPFVPLDAKKNRVMVQRAPEHGREA
jgi:hypothetical protein